MLDSTHCECLSLNQCASYVLFQWRWCNRELYVFVACKCLLLSDICESILATIFSLLGQYTFQKYFAALLCRYVPMLFEFNIESSESVISLI